MKVRALVSDGASSVDEVEQLAVADAEAGWVWIDIETHRDIDVDSLLAVTDRFGLDRVAVTESIAYLDIPRLDDFGHHLLAVFHTVLDDRIAANQVDCFLTDNRLVTVRTHSSEPLGLLWDALQHRDELATINVDEVAALLADVLTRRLARALDGVESRIEKLATRALDADPYVLEDLVTLRAETVVLRRAVHPQLEALDVLRHSSSPLISDDGRRRFGDAYGIANRTASAVDSARDAVVDTLDAYRGAEARHATDVSKVLTIYSAVMLPLSLIAGFFGMNFDSLPWTHSRWGTLGTLIAMVLLASVSLGVFLALGWIRMPWHGHRRHRVSTKPTAESDTAPAAVPPAMKHLQVNRRDPRPDAVQASN